MKRIAKSFVISVALLVFLWQQVGMEALAQNKRIVNPKQVYTYEMMTKDIERLAQQYPDLIEVKSIGQTPYGREIWAVKLGNGTPNVFFNGSHHAREWLTTNLLMDMLDQYAQAYKNKQEISGYNVQSILDHGSIWFVPMVNPDGVTLQQSGLKAFPKEDHKKLIAMNNGGSNFARWKANAQGVDLNRQYPAGWDTIRNNVDKPHYMNHKGSSALSTLEAKALADFTYEIDTEMTFSYHSSGRIIFWHYFNKPEHIERDKKLAEQLARLTGYQLIKPSSAPSGGGYKDWFIKEFGRPGFTPEIAPYVGETNPPLSIYDEEWRRNRLVGLHMAKEGYELWYTRMMKTSRVEVELNGEKQSFRQPAVTLNGRTVVPLRDIFTALGADVVWDGTTRTVIATKGQAKIQIQVGVKKAYINGTEVILDQPATLLQGTTMVPLRVVSEALGAHILWNNSAKTVHITLIEAQPEPESTEGTETPENLEEPESPKTFEPGEVQQEESDQKDSSATKGASTSTHP